jgi:hypothetical protein
MKVLAYLASRIQKKAFYCLKLYTQHTRYVNTMKRQQGVCMKRRWFEVWRDKFINKARYNYLCSIQRSIGKRRPSSVTFKEEIPSKRA